MANQEKLLVKVCGMREKANIEGLLQLPIDYIGHIFYPKSPRYLASPLAVSYPASVKKTGVFVNESQEQIKQHIQDFNLNAIQLHGDEPATLCEAFQASGVDIIKAFGIDDDFNWDRLAPYLPYVDYFLFDSKSAAYGGTGKAFNWNKLKDYPYDTPYFLSGGLSLENLQEVPAFADARLIGLDLNSKFETEPGLKDLDTLKKALKIINHEQISSK